MRSKEMNSSVVCHLSGKNESLTLTFVDAEIDGTLCDKSNILF